MRTAILLTITIFATTVPAQSPLPDCSQFEDHYFVNNPDSCRAYWYCENSDTEAVPDECPEGFNFDEGGQLCNTPEEYPCYDEEEPESPTPQPPPPSTICQDHEDGYFVNDPTGCRSYFVCINGLPFPGQCKVGFNFNESGQFCDRPSGTPCTNDQFECPFWGISRWEKPGSCTEFNFCFGGFHAVVECGPGLHFDTSINECNFPERAECTRDLCPISNDIDNIVTYPSENSCEQYYICYSGLLQEASCAKGIHWNQTNQRCELPEDANCQLPPDGTEPPGTTLPPFEIVCPPEDGQLHVFPHPFDCQYYFICSGNIPFEQRCIDGLLFDESSLQCNFAESAICADGSTTLSKKYRPTPKSNIFNDILTKIKHVE